VVRLDLAKGGNIMTNPDEAKGTRNQHLTETTKDGKIELTEEELKRVSGGVVADVDGRYTTTTKSKTE
jgi:bacteriocin-like protein